MLIVAYLAGFAWAVDNTAFDIWGAFLVAPVLLLVSLPLAKRISQAEDDPRIGRLILWAMVAKLLGSIPRYYMVYGLYDGVGDSHRYARAGAQLAEQFRDGVFAVDTGTQSVIGTPFIEIVTGWVFALTGPTMLGGFIVFSWLCFWGLYFFYRAFRVAVPTGDHRRYALLLFFLPSLLFWPSSIGKDSWMLFTLGMATYGAAKILARRHGGYLLLCLGVLGAGMVRPHMSALVLAGLAVAYVLPRKAERSSALSPFTKVIGALVLIAVCTVVLTRVEAFFGTEIGGVEGVNEVLDSTAEQTDTGGSRSDAQRVRSPADLPQAVIGVLFRPFPWEAHNAQSLASSVEGLLLLGLVAVSWPRWRALPLTVWRNPYLLLTIVYVVLFIVAFSSFGNFGILARQRTQVLPYFLVLLAAPRPLAVTDRWPRTRPTRMERR